MCAVREVHSCNVHPSLDHFLGLLHRSGNRSCVRTVCQLCYPRSQMWKWQLASKPTNCADDASVARHSRLWVNVQETHVLNEGVRHGSVELLGLNHVLWLRHGCDCVCRKCTVKTTKHYSFINGNVLRVVKPWLHYKSHPQHAHLKP